MKALGKSAASTSQAPPLHFLLLLLSLPTPLDLNLWGKYPSSSALSTASLFFPRGEVGWHLLVLSTQDERPWYWALLLGDST